jgi:proteasome lid subunit RPN8/RPN11
MIFPIVLKMPGQPAPAAALYYEVAENGVFQVRETAVYRAVTRVDGPIPSLAAEREHVVLRFPRLPRRTVPDVLAFFAEVHRRHDGEAMVLLFYRGETREFRIGVPPQTIPGRRRFDGRWRADHAVIYGTVARPDGFVRLGTIHSHADLPAYSSGVDCADERYEDGLHIVFGDFHRRELSIAAAFAAGGVRFRLAPRDVLEPCTVPGRPARPEWMAQVRRAADGAGSVPLVPLPPGPPGEIR